MRILISLMTIVVAGCATPESGSDALLVETIAHGQPLTDAQCTVRTGSGSWQLTTPANIVVGPVNGDLQIVCQKPGYRLAELNYRLPAGAGRPGVGLGVGGGSGGVGVGLGLSFPVGKRRGAYPNHFLVEMNPL